nr:hypothetical protein [Streptomyces cyaneus]
MPLDNSGGQQGEAHVGADAAENAVQRSELHAANADGAPRLQDALQAPAVGAAGTEYENLRVAHDPP